MHKLFITILISVVVTQLQSQVIIHPGTNVKANENVRIILHNMDLSNESAQTDVVDASIIVRGSGNIALLGSAKWTLGTLIIDKTNAAATLETDIQVRDSLVLQQGLLDLNGHMAIFNPTAELRRENNDNRVIAPNGGALQITVPLNMPVNANPGNFGAVITSTKNAGPVTVTRSHQQQMLPAQSVQRYFDIQPTAGNTLDGTLQFHYLDAELNGFDKTQLQMFRRANTGSGWQPLGGAVGNPPVGPVSRGLYTLSGVLESPLPLLWGPVMVNCVDGVVIIHWETLQEQNTDHFVIQRRAGNGLWENAGSLSAAGNSSSVRRYEWRDDGGAPTAFQYRIGCMDIDGSVNYSPTVYLQPCDVPVRAVLAPVPVKGSSVLSWHAQRHGLILIRIIGMDGRQHKTISREVFAGNNQLTLDMHPLPSGRYVLQVENGINRANVSFVKL